MISDATRDAIMPALHLVLAQVPAASHEQILTVLLGGAALLVIAERAWAFAERVKGAVKERPDPFNTYMTKDACEGQHEATSGQISSMSGKIDGLTSEVRALVHELRGEMQQGDSALREGLGRAHARIDGILERVAHVAGKVEAGGKNR
jgi:hypothetical protein